LIVAAVIDDGMMHKSHLTLHLLVWMIAFLHILGY